MESGKQYKVYAPDGLEFGYFLDGRLYEYLTSTCIGVLNDKNELMDQDEYLGKLEGEKFIQSDGKMLQIKEDQQP